jgi:hypothetical protein
MSIMKCTLLASAVISSVVFSSAILAAPPEDLIFNGDFETGDFSGWTKANTGSADFRINDGTLVPPGPGAPLPPISGNFDAVSTQTGPSIAAIEQTVSVPTGVFSARISLSDRVRNYASQGYVDPGQEWRVLIIDEDDIATEVYSTNTGDANVQIGPNSRSADITGLVQVNEGKSLRVTLEQQSRFFFMNATVDDVKLLVSTLPEIKDECKKGGWETFVNVNTGQQIFKNQGDCVSFVATQGKNPPANF